MLEHNSGINFLNNGESGFIKFKIIKGGYFNVHDKMKKVTGTLKLRPTPRSYRLSNSQDICFGMYQGSRIVRKSLTLLTYFSISV